MIAKGAIFSVESYTVDDLVRKTNTIYGTDLVSGIGSVQRINVRVIERIDTKFCPASENVLLIELADYPLCGSTPYASDFLFEKVE